jgi:hypothetical protein
VVRPRQLHRVEGRGFGLAVSVKGDAVRAPVRR